MKIINELITLPGRYTVPAETETHRNELARRAIGVKTVSTAAENDVGGAVAVALRGYLKDVEKLRVELTAPLLGGQRMLKATCDDHIAPLQEQLDRIEGLCKQFNKEEQDRVAAAEKLRQEAIAKAEKERQDAQAKLDAAAAKAHTQKGYAKAAAAAETLQVAEDKARAVITAPLPVAARAKGQTVKKVLKYEVLDIRAVYAARPELCKLEIKPSAVVSTCVPEIPVPGLKLWWEEDVSFSSRGAKPAQPAQPELTDKPPIDVSSLVFTDAKSSQIKDFAYDQDTQTLHLRFHRGGHYSYAAFPGEKFSAFVASDSKGTYLGHQIKPIHACTKLS
jgi:hypothetical protein